MPPGVDQVASDSLFSQSLARFQPMQALDQDEPIAVCANLDWRLLPNFENALGNFMDNVGINPASMLGGNIN
jgi:hypothetical protein